ncbi:MAG: Alpha-amylase 1 [Promethearchaeota archaeon]|nr:MAG: Alpha-amylase 1 [Candidatus Lokiarchaeota archaeon]
MKQKSIYLPIVFHFHQPTGNFPWVIEDTFKKSYGPLIENMYNFPEVKFTLHFSGFLLEWFIKNKPHAIEKVKHMAKRGQIEIIGGGFYEPIFAIIPSRDRIIQMNKLSQLIKDQFNLRVKGAWLSERVWEPSYPSFLNEAGLKYVVVDDNHLKTSGMVEEDTFYTYSTEDNGKRIRIFSINEQLRYLIPWRPTRESVHYLKEVATEEGDRIAVLISDAEKMGAWGSTHSFCYVEGSGHREGDNGKPFIPAFFEQIKMNEWIKTITLSEYMEKFSSKSLIYLPTASYDKMEEWVLPTNLRKQFSKLKEGFRMDEKNKKVHHFIRGGFWRQFLVKYPESNNMHKKMLHIREKLIEIESKIKKIDGESLILKINEKLEKAWEEIYKSQCNDVYWHGLFGGIYLQFLRFHIYEYLINAENIIDEIEDILYPKRNFYMTIYPKDFTKDSKPELILESNKLNLYFNPSDGGTLYELDYKPKSYNILNTLSRWEEAYHNPQKIKEGEINIDRFRRSMFRIRLFRKDTSLDEIRRDTYEELGDFVNSNYKVLKNEKEGEQGYIELFKKGIIRSPNIEEKLHCEIKNSFSVKDNVITVSIDGTIDDLERSNEKILEEEIENLSLGIDLPFFFNGDPKEFIWETDDLNLITEEEKDLLSPFGYTGTNFRATDKTYDLKFEINLKPDHNSYIIQKFPLIANLFVEEKYKDIYQGIAVMVRKKLTKSFTVQLKISLNHRKI